MRLPRSQRFWLDATGVAIAGALVAVAVRLTSPAQDLVVGIATSVIFATTLDALQGAQQRLINRQRIRFFGAELVRDQTTFVYPDFVMHDDVRTILNSHNQQMLFQRPNSRFKELTVHRIDIPRAVAANDMQALLYVASAFESTIQCPNVMMVDSAIIDDCDRSFISFGLSSNDCTHLYVNEHDSPLFHIVEDGAGSEFLRLRDGTEFRSTGRREYGMLVRYSPEPTDYPQRRWFLVSGLGPVGTTAAGWYLARHWHNLAERVPPDLNFAAVVSTGVYTDRVPRLEVVLVDEPSDA
jgi:hypothetical protein